MILRLQATGRPRAEGTPNPGGAVILRLPGGRDWDSTRNAAWDDLLSLAQQAWCWRDPDSLETIESCLDRLRRTVAADWS